MFEETQLFMIESLLCTEVIGEDGFEKVEEYFGEEEGGGGERIKGFLKFCPIILGFSEVWESLKWHDERDMMAGEGLGHSRDYNVTMYDIIIMVLCDFDLIWFLLILLSSFPM